MRTATLRRSGKKFSIRIRDAAGQVRDTPEAGRVELKKELEKLKAAGFECFNEKRGGKLVRV